MIRATWCIQPKEEAFHRQRPAPIRSSGTRVRGVGLPTYPRRAERDLLFGLKDRYDLSAIRKLDF